MFVHDSTFSIVFIPISVFKDSFKMNLTQFGILSLFMVLCSRAVESTDYCSLCSNHIACNNKNVYLINI